MEGNKPGNASFIWSQAKKVTILIDPHIPLNRLLIEGMKEYVSCPIGCKTSPGKGPPSEGPLADSAIRKTGEGDSPMFHLINYRDRFPAHHLHRWLIGEIIASLDGVEGMAINRIISSFRMIAQRRIDTSLSRYRVRSNRMDPGDHGDIAEFGQSYRSPQSRQTSAHNEHIMILDFSHGSDNPEVDCDQDDGNRSPQ